MDIKLQILDKKDFLTYKEKLIKLYLKAFTHGKFTQYISENEAENDWKKYFEVGEIYVALHDENLLGALVAYPLKQDENLPEQTVFGVDNSVYIAELMTDTAFQGKGIGTKLMNYFSENIDKNKYNEVVIRVWDENIPALSLYKKLGFQESGISILQTKFRTENESFTMKKIYLKKKINV